MYDRLGAGHDRIRRHVSQQRRISIHAICCETFG